jgi:hypothetical protein
MRRKSSLLRFVVPAVVVGVALDLAQVWPFQRNTALPPASIPAVSDPARDAYEGLHADFRAMVPLIEFAAIFQRVRDFEGGEAPRLADAQATEPVGAEPLLARIRIEQSADKASAEYEFARIEGIWKLESFAREPRKRLSPAPPVQGAESTPPKPVERKAVLVANPPTVAGPKTAGSQSSPGNWPCGYVIQPGDRLETISRHFYGTNRYWRRIVEANPGLDPKHLNIGRRIVIPAPPEHPPEHALESEPTPETPKR